MKFRMRCPYCGHDTMHHGESVVLRDEPRCDVFSCRGCGSACDVEDVEEFGQQYLAAVAAVRAAQEAAS